MALVKYSQSPPRQLSALAYSCTCLNQAATGCRRRFTTSTPTSTSPSSAEGGDNSRQGGNYEPSRHNFQRPWRRQAVKDEIQNVFRTSRSSNIGSNSYVRRSLIDPKTPNAESWLNNGPIDARSLKAELPNLSDPAGAGRSGSGSGTFPRILRVSPGARQEMQLRRTQGKMGNLRRSLLPAQGTTGSGGSGNGPRRRRRQREEGSDGPRGRQRRTGNSMEDRDGADEDVEEDDAVRAYERERREKDKERTVRYNPEPFTMEKLKETWPALPLGETGMAGSVTEKLSWMGERYVSSFDLTSDLAKRVYEGKRILFRSEKEKKDVMDLVQKMEEERVQKLTERKGTIVEPDDVSFQPATEKEKDEFLGILVRGDYEKRQKAQPGTTPAVADVLRKLWNNGTYQDADMEKFVDRLVKSLPPTLTKEERARTPGNNPQLFVDSSTDPTTCTIPIPP